MNRILGKRFYESVLEVGAGSLEHIRSINWDLFETYTATDIRYEEPSIAKSALSSMDMNLSERLRIEYGNAEALGYDDESFDLIIATCLLIHLPNPEKALREWKRVTKNSGDLIIYVPCEPGFALRVGRKLAVIPKHKRLGFENYSLVCAREHISSINILNTFIRHVFQDDQVKVYSWPIPRFLFWNFNLAYFYHIRVSENNRDTTIERIPEK
jgi:ubiquinone/menaquinone biosynthesis C-methylase UbiE